MSDELSWTEIAVTVPLSKAGRASEAGAERYLAALCDAARRVSPSGVVIEGADAPPTPEQAPPPEGSVRIKVYSLDEHIESALVTLGAAVAIYPGAEIVTKPLDPDWRERWKRWFKGFEVSPRLAVRPPWEPSSARDGQREIIIEPGLAFGTGQHATTRLCLEWVDGVFGDAGSPQRLLDVGCGTGVLSLGAVLLGAEEVLGVDNDPTAVVVARENLEANGIDTGAGKVRMETTPLAQVDDGWPVVVANILAPILLALCDDLVRVVEPGGRLLLSGLIASQTQELREAFEAAGATVVRIWTAGDCSWCDEDGTGADWTAIELTR